MSINEVIQKKIKQKGEVTVSDVVKETGFSRVYVHRQIKKMVDRGDLFKVGKTQKARYVSDANKKNTEVKSIIYYLNNKDLSEDDVWDKIKEIGYIKSLPVNVKRIFGYAFTEILNNAIDHSDGNKIIVKSELKSPLITFDISDNGVGIFNNIKRKKKLKNTVEAIQDLLKGRQTTMPQKHSGEGIFFTSKVAGRMVIYGSGKKIIFDNQINDIFVNDNPRRKGTRVVFSISKNSKKRIEDVFRQYTNEKFKFTKTKINIKLYEFDTELISRSQARRMLVGLEKFEHIVLDFEKVNFLAQGFADEVFRVWQKNNPKIKIEYRKTNDNVKLMIEHFLNS